MQFNNHISQQSFRHTSTFAHLKIEALEWVLFHPFFKTVPNSRHFGDFCNPFPMPLSRQSNIYILILGTKNLICHKLIFTNSFIEYRTVIHNHNYKGHFELLLQKR